MEYLRRKSGISCKGKPMFMGEIKKKIIPTPPKIREESLGVWGDYNDLLNTVFIYSSIRQFVFYKSLIFMPLKVLELARLFFKMNNIGI